MVERISNFGEREETSGLFSFCFTDNHTVHMEQIQADKKKYFSHQRYGTSMPLRVSKDNYHKQKVKLKAEVSDVRRIMRLFDRLGHDRICAFCDRLVSYLMLLRVTQRYQLQLFMIY